MGAGFDESCVCDPTPGAGDYSDYSMDEYSEASGSLCHFTLQKRVVGGVTTWTAACATVDCQQPCVPTLAIAGNGSRVLYCDCPNQGGDPFGGD